MSYNIGSSCYYDQVGSLVRKAKRRTRKRTVAADEKRCLCGARTLKNGLVTKSKFRMLQLIKFLWSVTHRSHSCRREVGVCQH